jgi:hypothetical protein
LVNTACTVAVSTVMSRAEVSPTSASGWGVDGVAGGAAGSGDVAAASLPGAVGCGCVCAAVDVGFGGGGAKYAWYM